MNTRVRFGLIAAAAAAVVVVYSLTPYGAATHADDKDKKIKIVLKAPIDHGIAPLPVHFVAQIEAPPEMDKEIYESSYEWVIMGRFVLTDPLTGGDATPPELRDRPMSMSEYSARRDKHLVSKAKKRSPRTPYKEGTEVTKSFDYDYTFEKGGEYFIQFKLKRGKYSSNEIRILVKGDTTYDPYRQR